MDTKTEIKEEDPHSDVLSQNEREYFSKNVIMKKNSDTLLFDNGCNIAFKAEIKPEPSFPDFCLQDKRKHFIRTLEKQINSETVTCSNSHEIDIKTEIGEQTLVLDTGYQKDREILSEEPLMKFEGHRSIYEMDNKIEIKDEHLWLETEASPASYDIKDGDIPPVKSQRLCREVVSEDTDVKSPLRYTEDLGECTGSCSGKGHLEYAAGTSSITTVPIVEELVVVVPQDVSTSEAAPPLNCTPPQQSAPATPLPTGSRNRRVRRYEPYDTTSQLLEAFNTQQEVMRQGNIKLCESLQEISKSLERMANAQMMAAKALVKNKK